MSKPIDERRGNWRFPLKLELSYRLRGHDAMVRGEGTIHNIGSRGVLFQADRRLQPNDEVELIIRWPVLLNDTARRTWWFGGGLFATMPKVAQ